MPAYHSTFNGADGGAGRVLNGIPLLPLVTKTRGPAPFADASLTYDAVDEALELFRANSLFRNFEIKGNGDRLLVYTLLFISQCLGKLKPTMGMGEATKTLYTLAVSNVVIPADPGFPLHNMYPAVERADADVLRQYLLQVRQEVALRLVPLVYSDAGQPAQTPSKWWLCFQKRYFMGKAMA
ncbi:subunit of the Arp2/3 complex [Coemansia spiralis]|nr:subunit of the Arp2/3 complex [Coemansia spiralis]